jgi:hypothetical protein
MTRLASIRTCRCTVGAPFADDHEFFFSAISAFFFVNDIIFMFQGCLR